MRVSKNKFFKSKFSNKRNISFLDNYELIINCDSSNLITNRYFSKKIVKKYGNVRYFIQKSTRITRGCFEILKYLKYDFVTFLYDDDIMGPYVFEIYKNKSFMV